MSGEKQSSSQTGFAWGELPDEALLNVRLCDLRLSIRSSPIYSQVEQLYAELERCGIVFRPHVWLSQEWFSPDGVPGIAVPFYLAHPRLAKLERSQMLECEGATATEFMKILRHEAGHALDNAYELRETEPWKTHFGNFAQPYPEHYKPAPASRDFVVHLNAWYAQAHPAEDYAETFAVWLASSQQKWQRQYEGWPALQKLQAIEEMVTAIRGVEAPNSNRQRIEPLSRCRITLAEHYRRKREFYEVGIPSEYDADLTRLFAPETPDNRTSRPRAALFLAHNRRALRSLVSVTTGVHHYTVDQFLKRMIDRCRQLTLVLRHDAQQTSNEFIALLTTQVVRAAYEGHARIPL